MATIDIFVSFEYDRDKKRKGDFYGQAKTLCPHRVRDSSLHEAYPTNEWKGKARAAIKKCDLVIVLIGADTHNASGVATEVSIARSLNKPVFQIKTRRRAYGGVDGIEAIPWRWRRINAKIDRLFPRSSR